ncbi:MAG: copper resistance protein CopC [Pseudomonadales bacterium]|nr:copper resistance protein CopC [Pseudomonadales bacterium]
MKLFDLPASLLRSAALFAVVALFAGTASAHTALKESTPADESTVQAPPAEINLVFNGPVRLVKLELMGSGKAVPTQFRPSAEALSSFTIETPNVTAGSYTVNWAAIGADGHTVSNSFSFVVGAASSAD